MADQRGPRRSRKRESDAAGASLDGADHRNHVGAAQAKSLDLPVEGVAGVDQRGSDAGLSRRAGDQPDVLQDVGDRRLRRKIPSDEPRSP
jgi:hypothetical protein